MSEVVEDVVSTEAGHCQCEECGPDCACATCECDNCTCPDCHHNAA